MVSEQHPPQGARGRRRARLPPLGRGPQPRRPPPRHLRPRAARAERPLLRRAARRLRDPGRPSWTRASCSCSAGAKEDRAERCAPWPPGSTASRCSVRLAAHVGSSRQAGRRHRRAVRRPASRRSPPRTSRVPDELTEHLLDARPHAACSSSVTPTRPPTSSSATRGSSPPTEDRGLTAAEPVRAEFRERDGTAVAERLLAGDFAADALVCGNDELALAIMARLTDGGVDVPDDIAIVGWDDVMTARYVRPGPDDRPPARARARGPRRRPPPRARLRRRPRAPSAGSCATEVVIRSSCGCPPGHAAGPRPAPPAPRASHLTSPTPPPPRK